MLKRFDNLKPIAIASSSLPKKNLILLIRRKCHLVIAKIFNTDELILLVITSISKFDIYLKKFNVIGIFSHQFKVIWTPWM